MKIIPVILSGGAGTRLWPVSRELHPKPFMRLADGESLIQKAFRLGAALPNVVEIVTVTNREFRFKTDDEYRTINPRQLPLAYILEPFGRNTAPAVAAAAGYIARTHGDDAIMLVLAADHVIVNAEAFAVAVAQAVQLAADNKLVTFGIRPNAPETGYGYIEAEGNRVVRFVEKPSRSAAEEYLASGRYVWNSGMFCFNAGILLKELAEHAPEVAASAQACLGASRKANGVEFTQVDLAPELFKTCPSISIDYALMEKSRNVAVVTCDIGWSDVGSWRALSELTPANEHGNRVVGQALFHDSTDCFIQSEGRVVGAVGVDNLVIIDTPDALLVADKSRSEDVKHIVAQLKTASHEACMVHRTAYRPWGSYTVLEEGERFKIKRIEVKPGASLSLQMHYHRSEHWIVVRGMARVVNGEQEMFVNTNESTFIPAGHSHRVENPGKLPLVMIEVQSGEYLAEDDIVRYDDQYGRVAEQ